MKLYQAMSKVFYPVAAIATVLSMVTPSMGQMQLDSEHIRPDARPSATIQLPQAEPQETPNDFLKTPQDPVVADDDDDDDDLDDAWLVFCLVHYFRQAHFEDAA